MLTYAHIIHTVTAFSVSLSLRLITALYLFGLEQNWLHFSDHSLKNLLNPG